MLVLCLEEAKREGKAARGRRLVHGPLAGEAQQRFWGIAMYGVEMLGNAAQRDPQAIALVKEGRLLLRALQEIARRRVI